MWNYGTSWPPIFPSLCLIFRWKLRVHDLTSHFLLQATRTRWYKSWAGLLKVQFCTSSRPGRSSPLPPLLHTSASTSSTNSRVHRPPLELCSPHLLFCLHHPPVWPSSPHPLPPSLFTFRPPHPSSSPSSLVGNLHPPRSFPTPPQIFHLLTFDSSLPSSCTTTNQSTGKEVKMRSCHEIGNFYWKIILW